MEREIEIPARTTNVSDVIRIINFDNVPNREFSRVSDEELKFFSNENNDRYLSELDPDFLKQFEDFPAEVDELTKSLIPFFRNHGPVDAARKASKK